MNGCLACTGWTNSAGRAPVHSAGCPKADDGVRGVFAAEWAAYQEGRRLRNVICLVCGASLADRHSHSMAEFEQATGHPVTGGSTPETINPPATNAPSDQAGEA